MRKRRGSAILYVMVMLVIMTGVTLTYSALGNAAWTIQTRREQAVTATLAFDGATLKAAYDAGLGKYSYPSTQSVTVGNYTCSVIVSDNSTNLGHSLSMSSTLSLGSRTYSDTRVTALKMPVSMFFYALASNTAATVGDHNTLGAASANGDLYCGGNVTLGAHNTINGDVESTGTIAQGSATVTGSQLTSVVPISFPVPNPSDYSSFSILNLLNILFGNHISGQAFLIPYSVVFCQGATTINGTFTGKGIIFVQGDVTVNGTMTYGSANDELAVIVTGNVTVQNPTASFVGYWYCGGTFTGLDNSSLSRGSIATNVLADSDHFSINYDPTIWNTPGEANRMKLPGFWP